MDNNERANMEPIDVWLRISDNEDHSDFDPLPNGTYPAEANTYRDGAGYRVDWYLTAVGQVISRKFVTLAEAYSWLDAEGFDNYTS